MKRILFFAVVFVILFPISLFAEEKELKETYIEDTGEYRYYIDDRNYVTSTQKLGGIVENVIKFTYNDYTYVSLYKDGKEAEILSGGYIYGEGDYTLKISNGKDSGSISFIIREPDTSDIGSSIYTKKDFEQSYSQERGMYVLSLNGSYTFYSDIPNYAITDKAVKIYTPSDKKMSIMAYKDGGEIGFSSGKTFSEPGYYVISFVYDTADVDDDRYSEEELAGFSEEDMGDASADSSYFGIADVAVYSFTVINGPQNMLGYINPPFGYEISSVMLEGQRQTVDNSFYRAEKDGNYRILFKGSQSGLPDYTLNFTRDTMPPRLSFEGVEKGGIAINRFRIKKDSEDTSVEIYKGGVPMENSPEEIDEDGLYRIVAYDNAGNAGAYIINLKRSIALSLLWLIPIIIAGAAAVWLYSSYIRKNIHIR